MTKSTKTGRPPTHGEATKGTESVEYRTWGRMKTRCTNPNDAAYRRYGGRGIVVCDRWSSFGNFLADMGRRPSAKHSIDRINNDGNYEPDNCRWATKSQQMSNRAVCRPITMGDETRLLTEWETVTGIDHRTIAARLDAGWPVESALSIPVGEMPPHFPGKDRKTHCVNGHEYTSETSGRNPAGWRFCRVCSRARQRIYMRAHRARKGTDMGVDL